MPRPNPRVWGRRRGFEGRGAADSATDGHERYRQCQLRCSVRQAPRAGKIERSGRGLVRWAGWGISSGQETPRGPGRTQRGMGRARGAGPSPQAIGVGELPTGWCAGGRASGRCSAVSFLFRICNHTRSGNRPVAWIADSLTRSWCVSPPYPMMCVRAYLKGRYQKRQQLVSFSHRVEPCPAPITEPTSANPIHIPTNQALPTGRTAAQRGGEHLKMYRCNTQ